jgi:hypothetical protein
MSSPREIVIFGPFAGELSEVVERPSSSFCCKLVSVVAMIFFGDLVDKF